MLRLLTLALVPVALLAAVPVRADTLRERDLDQLVRASTLAVRGEVVGLSADGADLHVVVDYLELGEKPDLLRVRSEGERALKPSLGDRGLFFVGPSRTARTGQAFVQFDFERWEVVPEADAAVDAFMARLVEACTKDSPAPLDDVWAQALELPVASLSLHGAHRLADLARRGAVGEKTWDRVFNYLAGPAPEDAKVAAVGALSGTLPAPRAVALLPKLADGSKVKAALLAPAGAQASASGEAKEQARAALGTASKDEAPEIALGAAVGLAALGDENALPALDRAILSGDVDGRNRAVEALAMLAAKGSRASRARLLALFEDSDGAVRAKARQAWVDAYFADPEWVRRSRPGKMMLIAAAVMVLLVLGHSLLERRRA